MRDNFGQRPDHTNYQYVATEYYKLLYPDVKFRNLQDWCETIKDSNHISLNKIKNTLEELEVSIDTKNFESVSEKTTEIIYLTYLLGVHLGINLDRSFDLVHCSNMSKICDTEQNAKDTVEWYKTNETRYDSPSYRHSEYGYVVFNESTGKILKNINYKKVDLSVMVY